MKELIELFEARRREIRLPHAVATVLRVEGSSYRRPGARMLINLHGRVAGSISGGCLEKAVVSQARAALVDGHARLLAFDTTDQDDLGLGTSLGCQGKIWIGLEILKANHPWPLESIARQICAGREPRVLVTSMTEDGSGIAFDSVVVGPDDVDILRTSLHWEAMKVLSSRKTQFVGENTQSGALIEWLAPPLRLLLFGGGYDVPPMIRLARDLGHEVLVIDRRPEIARVENFPEAHRVIAARPHEVSQHLSSDNRTVAVIMNHHYETDRDILAALLPLELLYVAMLGPKRRTQQILAELEAEGHELCAHHRAALHGPAGLDIGAETPEQIALAILAEIQAILTGRAGCQLRDRRAPIHSDPPERAPLCPISA
jgi:xanthine dehydrogenase accessory factor